MKTQTVGKSYADKILSCVAKNKPQNQLIDTGLIAKKKENHVLPSLSAILTASNSAVKEDYARVLMRANWSK